ncbi:hypothetical protein GCM10027020_38110 [Nocardioides salsibiostraticola]
MIVSHEHRFIFLKTRKTAGTSVEIALSTVCGPQDIVSPLSETDEVIRRERGGRGPMNFESPPLAKKAFAHAPAAQVRTIVGQQVWRDYTKISIERSPWDAIVSLYFWATRDEPEPPTFDAFVRSPRVRSLAEANAKIYRLRGEVIVEHLMRYESLAEDLTAVWGSLGLPGQPDLPVTKAHSRPAGSTAREMYDAETAAIVGEAFAPLVAELGYFF